MYRLLFTHVLSRMDPEDAHHLAFEVIRRLPILGIGRSARLVTRPAPALRTRALGLEFDSPFGVAAGFDKDGKAVLGLGQLGFGHVEVGTLTAVAQPGNPRPRLFRLIPDRAVINRMGFNNGGAAAAAERLAPLTRRKNRPVLGVNIGKSRVVDVENAIEDYRVSARALAPVADYLVVNVSSPNTPGLRGLQELDRLAPLLSAVLEESGSTPLLVKIAPDLSDEDVDAVADLAIELGLAGVIATNTTISRHGLRAPAGGLGAGGISGRPVRERSVEVLRRRRARAGDRLVLVAAGGI